MLPNNSYSFKPSVESGEILPNGSIAPLADRAALYLVSALGVSAVVSSREGLAWWIKAFLDRGGVPTIISYQGVR